MELKWDEVKYIALASWWKRMREGKLHQTTLAAKSRKVRSNELGAHSSISRVAKTSSSFFSASQKHWSLLRPILHKFPIHGTTISLIWFSWPFIFFLFYHLNVVFEMLGGFKKVYFCVTLLFALLQNSKELLLFWIIKQIAVKLTVRKLCRQRSTYIYIYLFADIFQMLN